MTEAALELVFHIVDGARLRYAQTDPKQADRVFQDIRQRRIFDQPLINIAGDYSMTGLSTRSVVKIDFATETLPRWPHVAGIDRLVRTDNEEFVAEAKLGSHDDGRRRDRPHEVGELSFSHLRFDLPGPLVDCFEVYSRMGANLDERRLLVQLMNAPCLYAELPGVGVTLYNPKLIERVTMLPGPPETPDGAWSAHFVSEEGAVIHGQP